MGNCSEPSKISKTGINACIFKTVFEILLGSEQLRKWNINKKKK